MNKKSIAVMVVLFLVIVFLFLASSTDLIIKETEPPVYDISILVDTSTDSGWENFQNGMQDAASKMNADASFIPLYLDANYNSPADRIAREVENDVDGLILAEENPSVLAQQLQSIPAGITVVTVGSTRISSTISANITPDWKQMSIDLADKIIQDTEGIPYIMIASPDNNQMNTYTMTVAFKDYLMRKGIMALETAITDSYSIQDLLADLDQTEDAVLVSFDESTLAQIGNSFSEEDYSFSLYGVGWNLDIRQQLESGSIKAVVVSNDYDTGYFAVQTVVNAISGNNNSVRDHVISHVVATKENMFTSPVEIVLFPIG